MKESARAIKQMILMITFLSFSQRFSFQHRLLALKEKDPDGLQAATDYLNDHLQRNGVNVHHFLIALNTIFDTQPEGPRRKIRTVAITGLPDTGKSLIGTACTSMMQKVEYGHCVTVCITHYLLV